MHWQRWVGIWMALASGSFGNLNANAAEAEPREAGDQSARLAEDPAAETERCRRAWSREARVTGAIDVTVWVNATGRVTGVATPPEADPLSAQAAQCAVLKLTYEPAIVDGQAVPGRVVVPIGFVAPPFISREPEPYEWRRCYPKSARNEGREGRIEVNVTVDAGGKIVEHAAQSDAEPWLVDAANCLIGRFEFTPGSNKGVPVQSNAIVALFFKIKVLNLDIAAETMAPTITGLRRKMPDEEDPTPASTEEEIIAAYGKCYPSGHDGTAKITYQITVPISGTVQKIEVVKGSGDVRLDEAGACVLRLLKFRPSTVNGHAVTSTLHWTLMVRPPLAPGAEGESTN